MSEAWEPNGGWAGQDTSPGQAVTPGMVEVAEKAKLERIAREQAEVKAWEESRRLNMAAAPTFADLKRLRAIGVSQAEWAGGVLKSVVFFPPETLPPRGFVLAGSEAARTPPAPGQPHATELVDAGGGVMVDPDLLGHEG